MDEKSPEPTEKDHLHISTVLWLRTWLRQEGGSEKIPRAIDLLAAQYEVALHKGIDPEPVDVETLTDLYLNKYGGKLGNTPPGRWLRKPLVDKWWASRREGIQQAAQSAGLHILPDIHISQSIGRGNSTEYSIAFHHVDDVPILEQELGLSRQAFESAAEPNQIVYTIESAKMSWWLSWLSSAPKYRSNSWRGYLLLAFLLVSGLFVLFIWVVGCAIIAKPGPAGFGDMLYFIIAAIGTWIEWHQFKPIFLLPNQRISIIPDSMLSFQQRYAQFRLIREYSALVPQGWLSIVRHSSICPVCSGEIDLCDGGTDFPGRIVGRCSNAPTEHVYSFDPVRLIGYNLRKV